MNFFGKFFVGKFQILNFKVNRRLKSAIKENSSRELKSVINPILNRELNYSIAVYSAILIFIVAFTFFNSVNFAIASEKNFYNKIYAEVRENFFETPRKNAAAQLRISIEKLSKILAGEIDEKLCKKILPEYDPISCQKEIYDFFAFEKLVAKNEMYTKFLFENTARYANFNRKNHDSDFDIILDLQLFRRLLFAENYVFDFPARETSFSPLPRSNFFARILNFPKVFATENAAEVEVCRDPEILNLQNLPTENSVAAGKVDTNFNEEIYDPVAAEERATRRKNSQNSTGENSAAATSPANSNSTNSGAENSTENSTNFGRRWETVAPIETVPTVLKNNFPKFETGTIDACPDGSFDFLGMTNICLPRFCEGIFCVELDVKSGFSEAKNCANFSGSKVSVGAAWNSLVDFINCKGDVDFWNSPEKATPKFSTNKNFYTRDNSLPAVLRSQISFSKIAPSVEDGLENWPKLTPGFFEFQKNSLPDAQKHRVVVDGDFVPNDIIFEMLFEEDCWNFLRGAYETPSEKILQNCESDLVKITPQISENDFILRAKIDDLAIWEKNFSQSNELFVGEFKTLFEKINLLFARPESIVPNELLKTIRKKKCKEK